MRQITPNIKGGAKKAGMEPVDYAAMLDAGFLRCGRCKKWKHPESFPLSRTVKRGRYYYCKPCQAEYTATKKVQLILSGCCPTCKQPVK